MQDEIDLEYYVSEISDPMSGIFYAIEDDEPVERIDGDLDSVQEALDNYGKVFLEIGYFSYNDEYETRLMFDGDEFIIGLSDRYYDKYKFSLAGYGIFLDSDLNVECGYYTTEAPPSGHGPGDITIYDFKDAEKDDLVKEHIYSLLSWAGIENSQTSHHESNTELVNQETNIEILQNKLKSLKDMITSITKLNNLETDIPQDKREKFEDTIIDLVETAENLLTDIKNNLYHGSYFSHELNNVYKIESEINKIEKKILPKIKQNFCGALFKRIYLEIDKDHYSSLCEKISDFFSLNFKSNDEILKYLCNNFPENSVYLFILHYEPMALPGITFDKGLHKRGLLIRLNNGTVLSNWRDVTEKDNVEYVIEDLSNKRKLSGKYKSLKNLRSIKLTGINKNVTDMSKMFHACISLEDISGLSNLDVSNVTNMEKMFANCRSLVDVSALSEWDVSNVNTMMGMFLNCDSLVDLSGLIKWDVSNVGNMWAMFIDCSSLVDVSALSEWDVSNVGNMFNMFNDCRSLVDVSALSEWDVSNVYTMQQMFSNCESLVDVSSLNTWDVSNVEDMLCMFDYCKSLVDISGLSEWDVSNVYSMEDMFAHCRSLVDISGLSKWNVSNVNFVMGMFYHCESLVDVSSLCDWDLSSVTNMSGMFVGCKSLVDVSALGKWNTSNVKSISAMFSGCESLVNISGLGNWDISNVKDMEYMFKDCKSLADISDLSEWDISNVENMEDMFEDCKSLADDSLLKYWTDIMVNKIEKNTIPKIKQSFCSDLFKKVHAEIDKDYYSSLCKKIADFFSLNYKTDDEILKYLCNNFPENSVYLFILHYEPDALPNTTFDKGLHEGGLIIRLKNGAILSSWNDLVKKSNVEYVIEDLSNETDLSGKYKSCTNLKSVKLTGIKKEVTDMSNMFNGCGSLEDVSGLSDLNVSNVGNMKYMFTYCKSLVDVSALSKWDVSNVTNMWGMFMGCKSLVDVSGLSKWDVSNVTNMWGMFMHCNSLVDISGLGKWDVSNVKDMGYMFMDCRSLIDISALGEWNVSNVKNMGYIFEDCKSLVDLSPLSNWKVFKANKEGMFAKCPAIKSYPSWDE